MDPVSITGLTIAITQVIAACLKASRKVLGPSQHSSKFLQEINTELYSFNAAVANLETHLKACKDDPTRLHALSGLQEPLKLSERTVELIKIRLEDATFIGKLRKHVLGASFDEKLNGYLRSLQMSRTLFSELLEMDSRNINSRIIISAIEKHVLDFAKDITILKSDLRSLDSQNRQNHEETRTWQVKAENRIQDDEDRKTLDWLSSLNFVAKQNDVLRTRHEKTGDWFLNSSQFGDWLAGPPRMLWCPGILGAGKTVIASIAVDHLSATFKDQDSAVLCVFLNHADQQRQTSTDLVASILEQLVRTKGVTGEIRALYQRHQMRNTRPGLAEFSKLLHLMIEESTKVFIIIDALDECPETTRRAFVGEVHKLRSRAHVLITSRPASAIAYAHDLELHDAIHLEIQALNSDLEMYIRDKTQQDPDLARYLEHDLALQEEVVTTIVNNARGMFLLVKLHVDSLAKQKTKRAMRKALTSLPKELDETYDSAMERIRSQDTESVRVAERALAWITNARRPFYVEELQHALAIQPDETSFDEEAIYAEDDLVSLCAGLVTIDRESHVIRMVHYTAQDYFERVRNEMFPTIQVEIAKACINYLQLDDFESDEYTDGNNYIEVSDKLHSRYPFLDYAGKQWGFHARGEAEYEVGEMICCLLEKKMRLWFACAILDDSVGMWDFGPRPDLTLLIYFGLELLVKYAITLNKSRLTCAIRVRHNTLSFLLAESGADWFDRKGKSIRAECSSFRLNGNEAMVILLVNKGVKMDLSVDNGEFLYAWSLIQNAGAENKEPMLTLLKLGASVDPQNVTSYTQLMTAVIGSDVLDVRALLNAGVDVNEKNEHNRDALTYAASARHEEVVRPLLEAGADIHSRDADGMTALCAACECGNGKIVKLLLENGADISAQDRSGRTPISIATERGHETLARTLRRYGIEGHWEDEAEGKDAVELDRAKFNKLSEFMRRDHELGSPGYKFVESVERATLRQGYDKSMVAFLDAFCEHIANEEKLTTTGEQGAEGLHSELMAFAKEYLKRKEHEKGSTSIETQEPFLANLANERIMVRERLGERMTDAVIKKYMGIEFPLTGSTFVRGVD